MASDSNDLSLTVLARFAWDFNKTLNTGGAQPIKDSRLVKQQTTLTEGVGNLLNNQLWADHRFVSAPSPNDDLDLSGAMQNSFGEIINFVQVKAILVINNATAAGDNLHFGGAVANQFKSPFNNVGASLLVIGANSPLILAKLVDGFTVVAGTADILRIAYAGVSGYISYDIVIAGVKA